MSMLDGEVIVCGQSAGPAVELVIYGDEFYARYETQTGYTVVYDTQLGRYSYAKLLNGAFISSGVHINKPAPLGIRRHLKENPEVRNQKFQRRYAELRPPESQRLSHEALTLGPEDGLLSGRRLTEGHVTGLTLLVNFDDVRTNISGEDVNEMLNGQDYQRNGNFCSAREYFELVSTGKLTYTNYVVGPLQLSKRRSHYINNLLVEEALDLARVALQAEGKSLSDFDSRGEGVIDALNILYAGRTQYSGNLWPHNSVTTLFRDGVKTHFYLLTSAGREPVDLSIGTFCHENGHLLCRFPDMYDYGNRDGDGEKSQGIGQFCLMGSGNHNDQGRIPSPVCGYLRDLVGWVDNTVWLNRVESATAKHADYSTVHKYPTNMINEYFIVENRSKMGLDSGLPDSGLAVYHCDTLGSNEWQSGTRERHYQCALLQADGHLDLENNRNRGDAGDLFPETPGIAVSHETTPSSRQWDGSDSGLVLSQISSPGQEITFQLGTVTANQVVQLSITPDLLIPDNLEEGIASTLTVSQPGTVKSVSVWVDIIHTWIGDLIVTLKSPSGEHVILHNREGQSGDDINKRYTPTHLSHLSEFNGKSMMGGWKLHVSDQAGQDVGRLNSWGLEIEYDDVSHSFEETIQANLAIPDRDVTGVESRMVVDMDAVLADIEVSVDIAHTYISDLQVVLISPSGQSANLHLYEGGSRDNLKAVYHPDTTPDLMTLIGIGIKGEWVLKVADRAVADTGELISWSLKLVY